MSAGMTQGGLKKLASIVARNSGLWLRSTSSPTTTRVEKTGWSARYSTSRSSATLTQARSAGSCRGSQRWRSRFTSIVRRRLVAALLPAGGARAIFLQGLAQRPVGRRRRRQRLDHRPRIGAVDGVVEHGRHIDRLRRQDLVIAPALDRHGAAGQRVGIGQEGVRQQQFAARVATMSRRAAAGPHGTARGRDPGRRRAARHPPANSPVPCRVVHTGSKPWRA